MTRVTELANLAVERRKQFSTTLNEIKSRPAIPAIAASGLALFALFAARRLAKTIAARLADHR